MRIRNRVISKVVAGPQRNRCIHEIYEKFQSVGIAKMRVVLKNKKKIGKKDIWGYVAIMVPFL